MAQYILCISLLHFAQVQLSSLAVFASACAAYLLMLIPLESKQQSTLFSGCKGSLLRRQPGAMKIAHSPKGSYLYL